MDFKTTLVPITKGVAIIGLLRAGFSLSFYGENVLLKLMIKLEGQHVCALEINFISLLFTDDQKSNNNYPHLFTTEILVKCFINKKRAYIVKNIHCRKFKRLNLIIIPSNYVLIFFNYISILFFFINKFQYLKTKEQ